MKTKIKEITIENFKGSKNREYLFDGGNAEISGANGAGKTTIMTAFMWVFADKDSELHSNPMIRPIGAEEITPRVEIVLDVDGTEVTVAKIQKRTVKKSKTGGADTVNLSNSYEVNSVEYGERDFKKKMSEYGFDFELFLPLSHTDVFTSQKYTDMRKVLFSMASEKSDKEIADLTDGAAEVAELLGKYSAEEVKAMQNATLRKIKEVYGKDGEILRAKIEGMEQSKIDIDVAELELLRNSLKEQIAENKEKQESTEKQFEEYQKLSDGIMDLKFAESGLQRKAKEGLEKQRGSIGSEQWDKQKELNEVEYQIRLNKQDIERGKKEIERKTILINAARDNWTSANERVFDENNLVCSYCGQEYPSEKKEQLRAEFEAHRQEELSFITDRGNELKVAIDKGKEEIEQLKTTLADNEKSKIKLETQIAELETQYNEIPKSIDISSTEEYKAIQLQIAEKEKALAKMNNSDEVRQMLKDELEDLQSRLTECEKQIAKSEVNMQIDEDIENLRKKQTEFEQAKANAEKILYQLDLVYRKKNELLTDDINKNFDIVKWQLFAYQKNGEYKDCCIPLIDGKRFGESTNTGREVLAKLDIIKGLQRFYGRFYPVFLDGAECLSDETRKRIEMDCQIIYLCVTEGKELKLEVSE